MPTLLKKERQSQIRKAKTRLSKCEQEINEVEDELSEIEEKLSSSDYEELLKLTAELEEKTALRDKLYEEWEELSALLEE